MWGHSGANPADHDQDKTDDQGIPCKLKPAFVALLEAYDCANDTATEVWEFAVAIRQLQQLGLNETDLRWLVCKGYVDHAKEITRIEDRVRKFRSAGNLSFCKKTCFVLTDSGVSQGRAFNQVRDIAAESGQGESQNGKSSSLPLPVWNPETRELRINGTVVKRFKWQAVNQEIVLSAFEEDGWPAVIDDPLPQKPEHDPKCRLHDTIKALNRNQEHAILRFHGNGTGEGIRWEIVAISGE